jgi:hypothetical protein
LCKESSFKHSKIELSKTIDFSSISILTRAALESYLTFNHIFVAPSTEEDKELRYLCWDMAGIIEREDYPTRNPEFKQRKHDEQVEKHELLDRIKNNPFFKKLSSDGKKRVQKGNWRIFKQWHDLAREAKLSEEYFKVTYSYLSSYCHSGRLSIMQIEQSNNLNTQRDLCDTLIQMNIVIIARLIHDYIDFMPDCKTSFESNLEAVKYTELFYKLGSMIDLTQESYLKK